jgi:glycosyltransferase involved in cell wall biosynthesis
MSTTVAIIQRRLTHYRVPLFEAMRAELAEKDIQLRLLHGTPTKEEALKKDSGHLPWAEPLRTRYFANGKLMWQPFAHATAACDLVIVTQENKHLNNLPPLLNPWRRQRLAFWGHGRNMQAARPDGAGERFKRWTTRQVDWWFAYTELSARFVREDGFPAERISVLNNSIDTGALRARVNDAKLLPPTALRAQLRLAQPGPVGLFMGSLYADKRLEFLIEAAVRIRRQVPNFQLLIAGDGPQRGLVEQAAGLHPWIRWVGAVQGSDKAACLAVADLMLNPGLVGLGILDAFVAGLPMVTTDCGLHSPEIAYLDTGINGAMTDNTVEAYSTHCLALLNQHERRKAMGHAASLAADTFSIAAMAQRFCSGIQRALA